MLNEHGGVRRAMRHLNPLISFTLAPSYTYLSSLISVLKAMCAHTHTLTHTHTHTHTLLCLSFSRTLSSVPLICSQLPKHKVLSHPFSPFFFFPSFSCSPSESQVKKMNGLHTWQGALLLKKS